MAEHVGHELARSGFPVRPSHVGTLARWLDSWGAPPPAPRPLLLALIDAALERIRPPRFAPVAEFRGFQSSVADLFEEAPEEALASGACGAELAAIFEAVRQGLAARGMALRNARLRSAAASIREGAGDLPAHAVFDGFFAFSPAELDLLEAIAARTEATVTLPEFEGARETHDRLLSAGFAPRYLAASRRSPRCVAFSASTAEREAEEIARRILEQVSRGRRFREMGIVLRSRDPYAPLIETTLARFGIPAQSYFADPLERHPAIAYLEGLVRAGLNGWDHKELLALMRMPVSGWGATPEGDQADFAARARLPGKGLPFADLEALASIEALRRARCEPAAWVERCKALRKLIPAPQVVDRAGWDEVWALRSTAAVLNAFDAALEQAAEAFPASSPIGLAAFWKQLETVLAVEVLRVADHRRDVVHVMDVQEARQWELPVVFVCGMLEREFPRYHAEDPLLGEAARRKLGLETSAERNREERFLFGLAVSRATAEVVLSYSRFDEKGDKTLPSFFLEGIEVKPCEARVQPAPERAVTPPALAPIQSPALLRELAKRHRKLSASGIESFLQCPFQFFAEKTLKLRERPAVPADRMDYRVRGNVIHQALAEWTAAPLLGTDILNRVFEDECQRLRIPFTYRTEAVRLQLLRHFEAFIQAAGVSLGWRTEAEVKFEFPLNPSVTIRGRIDRLDIGPEGQALVIDYKYSAAQKIRQRVQASDAGELVQAGVYLLAAERALKLNPVGMLYCGLKQEIVWDGWHVALPGLERIGTAGTVASLREQMQATALRIEETYDSIAAGRIEAHPADDSKCHFCGFRDACRVESLEQPAQIGAAS